MSVEVSIICDECGRVADAAKTAAKARQAIREAGGRVGLPGGKDICNWCVSDAKDATAPAPDASGAVGGPDSAGQEAQP